MKGRRRSKEGTITSQMEHGLCWGKGRAGGSPLRCCNSITESLTHAYGEWFTQTIPGGLLEIQNLKPPDDADITSRFQ